MTPFVVFVAGIPAAGKTVYARHLAEKLGVPFISKDAFKEKMHDVIGYDTALRENSRLYGNAAYQICYYVAEALMKAGTSFVLESNFSPDSVEPLRTLVEKYSYGAFTVLVDGEIGVIHKRFLGRDKTPERHPRPGGRRRYLRQPGGLPKCSFTLAELLLGRTLHFRCHGFQQSGLRISRQSCPAFYRPML